MVGGHLWEKVEEEKQRVVRVALLHLLRLDCASLLLVVVLLLLAWWIYLRLLAMLFNCRGVEWSGEARRELHLVRLGRGILVGPTGGWERNPLGRMELLGLIRLPCLTGPLIYRGFTVPTKTDKIL